MKILGFSYTKVSGERFKDNADNVKINTEMDIPDVKEVNPSILKLDEGLLEAQFSYKVNYDPGLAKIILEGKVLFSLEKKETQELLNGWKKKKLSEDVRIPLLNVIMKKSALKALTLCDELNLPVHIPLPTLKKE